MVKGMNAVIKALYAEDIRTQSSNKERKDFGDITKAIEESFQQKEDDDGKE
jgi:hypothetical protein